MTRKLKVLAALFLAVLLSFSAAGCGDREGLGLVKQAVRFKDNYKTDAMEVFCDWDAVNPFLDACEYEKYGLQTGFVDDKTFRYYEEEFNVIWLSEDLPTLVNHEKDKTGRIDLSYGAIDCSSFDNSRNPKYFAEPMIEVYIYNPNSIGAKQLEPEYLPGYRAVYSLDGMLALCEGEWFLKEDKYEFCRYYFEIMLKIIGKG